MTLITIQAGSEASSTTLNNNFEYLDERITDEVSEISTTLTGKISTLETSITSQYETLSSNLSSQIESIEDSLDETTQSLNSVLSNIAPNYASATTISSGWTATKYGWLSCECHSSANYVGYVNVNGVMVARDYQISGDSRAGTHYSLSMAFVSKGDVVTFSNSTVKFYPCKGA